MLLNVLVVGVRRDMERRNISGKLRGTNLKEGKKHPIKSFQGDQHRNGQKKM